MPIATMKGLLGFTLAVYLSACSHTTAPPAPKNPDQALYEAVAAFDGMVRQAVIYADLPACVPQGPTLCSDGKTVLGLLAAARRGREAEKTAREVVNNYARLTTPTVSQTGQAYAAIAALTAAQVDIQALIGSVK